MTDTRPVVWLPYDPTELINRPEGLRYVGVPPGHTDPLPPSSSEVEFYLVPYSFGEVDTSVFAKLPKLAVVQTQTAGVDHIRPHLPSDVLLCNGRGIHDASTAELALTLTLASRRGIPEFVRAAQAGEWVYQWRPALADATVMIVGYGQIGAAIERRLVPFEVAEVIRVARSEKPGVHAISAVQKLLPRADVVILILPATAETVGLIDAEFLAAMKPGALLVNVARGPVVQTDALVNALTERRIWAALDVTDPEPLPPEHPLWSAPQCLISPHVGGATSAMRPRSDRLVVAQLQRYLAGQPLANQMTGDY